MLTKIQNFLDCYIYELLPLNFIKWQFNSFSAKRGEGNYNHQSPSWSSNKHDSHLGKKVFRPLVTNCFSPWKKNGKDLAEREKCNVFVVKIAFLTLHTLSVRKLRDIEGSACLFSLVSISLTFFVKFFLWSSEIVCVFC